MKKMKVQQLPEDLSGALVLSDAADLAALADIHSRFEELASCAESSSQSEAAESCLRASAVIEKVILDEISDKTAAIEVVGRTVSALQSIIRDGRNATEVDLPSELAVLATETEPPDAARKDAQAQAGSARPAVVLSGNPDQAAGTAGCASGAGALREGNVS
ncbi:MAG: hypothetical protein ACYTAN_06120 [Planctomycetota bacterium]|jgi:hypothetical protein